MYITIKSKKELLQILSKEWNPNSVHQLMCCGKTIEVEHIKNIKESRFYALSKGYIYRSIMEPRWWWKEEWCNTLEEKLRLIK